MKEFSLWRLSQSRSGTLGVIVGLSGKVCNTLEPPWRNNRANVSCIPSGTYTVTYLARSGSGKYKDCYWVRAVDSRSAILIHKGNVVSDTMGCILPGTRLGVLGGALAVLNSRGGIRALHKQANREEFILHVRDDIIRPG